MINVALLSNRVLDKISYCHSIPDVPPGNIALVANTPGTKADTADRAEPVAHFAKLALALDTLVNLNTSTHKPQAANFALDQAVLGGNRERFLVLLFGPRPLGFHAQ